MAMMKYQKEKVCCLLSNIGSLFSTLRGSDFLSHSHAEPEKGATPQRGHCDLSAEKDLFAPPTRSKFSRALLRLVYGAGISGKPIKPMTTLPF